MSCRYQVSIAAHTFRSYGAETTPDTVCYKHSIPNGIGTAQESPQNKGISLSSKASASQLKQHELYPNTTPGNRVWSHVIPRNAGSLSAIVANTSSADIHGESTPLA